MRWLRDADLNEVLSAGLHFDGATRQAIVIRAPFSVWRLESAEDVGDIGTQLQGESAGADSARVGKIRDLYGGWQRWLHGAHSKAIEDLASHARLLGMLRDGKVFATRAIIFDDAKQMHDGRHRMFALYEFVRGDNPLPAVDVFWNRALPP